MGGRGARARWWGLAFGAGPDLLSFGFFTAGSVLGQYGRLDFSNGPPDPAIVPLYIHRLYDVTHSFVVFGAAFALVWAVRRKPFLPMLAWPLHIAMDIFTHGTSFFPTPWLWPLPHPKVNGIPWSTPWIFWSNWSALLVCGALLYARHWRETRRKLAIEREARERMMTEREFKP